MKIKNNVYTIVMALVLVSAVTASAALTEAYRWDFEGTAGQPAADPSVATTGGIDLDKTGSFNHDSTFNAGVGVELTNASSESNVAADQYYQSATGQVTLDDTSNWGFETWVKLNKIGGESAVAQIGNGATSVIMQTLSVVDGPSAAGGGWTIHVPGLFIGVSDAAYAKVGEEQHVAAIMDGGAWSLYVDGVERPMNIVVNDTQIITPSANVLVGAAYQGLDINRGLDGDIGVVRVFDFDAGTFDINQTLIPEPTSLGLILLFGCVAFLRRRCMR